METACEALRDCEMTAAARRLDDGEAEIPLASLDARKTEERSIVGKWFFSGIYNETMSGDWGVITEGFCD